MQLSHEVFDYHLLMQFSQTYVIYGPIWKETVPDLKCWQIIFVITDLMDMSLSKLWDMMMDREGLVCCGPLDHKESDWATELSWTKKVQTLKQGATPCLLLL